MRLILVLFLLLSSFTAAQVDPVSPSEQEAGFLFRQGLFLLEQGQAARATELFKKSLRLEPERLEIRPYLARSLYEQKEYEASLRQLDLYLNEEPSDPKVGLFRVKTLVALEQLGQADDALELLRDAHRESWEWHNLKGYLQEKAGILDQAEASYLQAAELAGAETYEPSTNLIALWLSQEKVEEATILVGTMLDQAGDNPEVLNAFALLLSKKERGFDPDVILQAVKGKSIPFELQYNLSAALAERQETDQAALLAADLVDRFPEEARASWLYGRILLQRRELAEAGEFLTASVDKLPTSDESVQTMGAYAYLVGDFEEAVGWYQQALKRTPDSAEVSHNLSMALSRLDRLEEAAQASVEAVRLNGEDARLVYQLALVLDRDGKIEEASKYYRRFLELNEDQAQAAIVREHLSELKVKP